MEVRQWFVATDAWWAPLAWCHRSSTISARSAHVSTSPWNYSAVPDGQLYTHSRSHWPSTSAFCHSAEVGRTALSIEQFRSSAIFCGGPVDLEFAAKQSSWPRTESRYFQTSAEDIYFCEILVTKCIKKRIRDLFECALYKFTLCLLTYLLSSRLHHTCFRLQTSHWQRT